MSGTPSRRVTARASSRICSRSLSGSSLSRTCTRSTPPATAASRNAARSRRAAVTRYSRESAAGHGSGDDEAVAILEPHLLVARSLDRLAVSLDERESHAEPEPLEQPGDGFPLDDLLVAAVDHDARTHGSCTAPMSGLEATASTPSAMIPARRATRPA